MATKINQAFYGAENSFVTLTPNTKYSPYTLQNLVTRGVYNGGSLDTTASPWGIGQSSISSQFAFFPTKGASWTLFDTHNDKKNTPLFFFRSSEPKYGFSGPWDLVGASATDANFTKAIYKSRTYPNAVINNNQVKSNLLLDSGARVDLDYTTYISYLTYMNYQKIRVYPRLVYYIPTDSDTIQSTSLDNIINHSVSVDYIVGIIVTTIDRDGGVVNLSYSVGSYELPIPDEFKPCYYTNADKWVRPWRSCYFIGHWDFSSNFGVQFRAFNTDDVYYTSQFETPNSGNPIRGYQVVTGYGSMSRHNQVFDDVSYHWEYGMTPYGTTIHTVEPINTGDLYQAGLYWCYSRMVLDGEYTDKNLAFVNAIMHELAFIGLPCARTASEAQNNIGSNYIHLPVFDEHMVTTGDFKKGSDSTNLPNATWQNIFDNSMPVYDPTYDPDPQPEPEDDEGDLNNLGHNRYMGKGLKVYVMPTANYTQSFLPAINALYQNKTPDDWTVDFQGENPSNYIVSAFSTFFAVPTQGISTNITLGVVDTGITADVYDRGKPQAETFTFGTRHINPVYNDFRDYAPYTNIELYLPLCGTIPLETAYVMNHDITITYWYDITTMSCTACVYRDNMLYKTLDGTLGVPAPLLASDMGNYQNQIKQLENAKTQNNMRIATSAVSLTAGIAAAVASGGTAVVPEAMGIAGGVAGLSKSIETANEIQYKIDHTTPSISTTSASESQNNMCVGQLIPKLIIKRPLMLPNKNDAIYSKTVGNACCINNSVGDNSGFIKCSNVDLSGVTATAAEISAIQNLLTSGVYV